MSATCGNCKWWWSWRHIGENGAGKGECRRFPPVPMPMANSVGGGVDRVTPVTGAHYWCGEHAPQPKKTRDEAALPKTVEDVLRNYVKQFVKEAARELNVERSRALHDKANAIEAALLILFPPSATEESPDE